MGLWAQAGADTTFRTLLAEVPDTGGVGVTHRTNDDDVSDVFAKSWWYLRPRTRSGSLTSLYSGATRGSRWCGALGYAA
jgi:hypothetical protein